MNQARLKYHRSLWSGGSPPALLEVLISRRGSKASDLRDMIFGHDAVTGHICPRTIHRKWPILHNWKSLYYMTHVDYTQSVEDVYTRAAVYSACFDSPNGIRRLLYHAATKASHVKRDGLPSWVPDWALDLSDVQNPCWPFSNDPMNLVDIPLADEFNCGYIPASRYILTFFYRNTTYELEIVEHTSQLEIDGSQSPLNKVVYGYYRHPNQKKPERSDLWSSYPPIPIFRMLRSLWQSLVTANVWPRPQDSGCVFRPIQNYQDPEFDDRIDDEIRTGTGNKPPILHYTYIGRAWTDKADYDQEITTEGKSDTNLEEISIIAVH